MSPFFPLHDPSSVPALAKVEDEFGMVPNLERAMATAPALLEGYGTVSKLFEKSSFSAIEKQVVYQAINTAHGCSY